MAPGVLYGDCLDQRGSNPVRITSLGSTSCTLGEETPGALSEGNMELWIGAIGPLPAIGTRSVQGDVFAHFTAPLDSRIIAHFNN